MVICNKIEINFQNFIYNKNKNNSPYNVPYNIFLHKNLFDYKINPVKIRELSIKTYYPPEFNYFNSEKKHLEYINEYLNNIIIKKCIKNEVINFSSKYFNNTTISIHIRTWFSTFNNYSNDYKASNRRKNNDIVLNSIYKLMDERINNNDDITFFISIDDYTYRDIIKKRYKNRIIFYERSNNLNNIQNDFVELLLLGYNKELIGNKCSTFSKWAWYFKKDICEKTIMLDHVTGEIYYEGLNTTL